MRRGGKAFRRRWSARGQAAFAPFSLCGSATLRETFSCPISKDFTANRLSPSHSPPRANMMPTSHFSPSLRALSLILVILALLLTGGTARADGSCHVQPTPYYTEYYGSLTLDGQPAPAQTLVEAYNGDGVQTGCFVVQIPGVLGYMRVYGADPQTGTPGMGYNEPVLFKLGGGTATSDPATILWTGDKAQHHITLTATSAPPAVDDLAAQIAGGDIQLTWSDVGGTVDHYEVWRAPTPYFTPGNAGTERIASNVAPVPGDAVAYTDGTSHIGNLGINDYYVVLAVNANGDAWPASVYVGGFDFGLIPGQ